MLAIHNTHHAPPTPPYTSTFLSRTTTTLPPITHLDRIQPPHKLTVLHGDRLPTQRPVTPPEEDMLPGKPTIPSDAPHLVDWLDFTRSRSAHFIAEKTCEMICYLWHATPSTPSEAHISTLSDANAYPSPKNSPPTSALTHTSHPAAPTSFQQLVVTPAFVSFVQKILETTQVSQSVIVLSLHYIYKLKEKTSLVGPPGSEFRIAVAALMMANKFLDDNTYTNKTWSEVSGIELLEVNKMEKEFLTGVEYNLYVDKATYEAWLNLLKGLVMAKERDLSRARERRRQKRRLAGAVTHGQAHTPGGRLRYFRTVGNGHYVQSTSQPNRQAVQRARSTSPVSRFSQPHHPQPVFHQLPPIQTQPPPCFSNASSPYSQQSNSQTSYNYKPASYNYSPSPAPSSLKRSAATAFSPTSASFSHVPTKRPGVTTTDSLPSIATSGGFASLAIDQVSNHASHQRPGITLQIPQEQRPAPHSYSPMDNLPLQGFANMNLDSTSSVPSAAPYTSTSNSLSSALGPMPCERVGEMRERKQHMRMSTLVQPYAYTADDQRRGVPKHLYFYTLACSPLENTPNGLSKAPSPAYPRQQEDYDMEREAILQRERELEREREREFERQRELDIEREKEREMERERQRKARLRVHRPAPVSSIRYSDYAYMPYVSSTGVTGHPMNGIHPSYLPSSTAHGSSAASTVVPRQSQSVRTSPVVNTGRHFDAVRFEVERTQGYAPASSGQYDQQRQPSSQQQAPRPQSQSQHYYSSPSVALPHTSGVRKPQGQNPYPQLSPPTPATSTSTSPVTLAPPPPRTTCVNNAATHIDHHGSPFNGTTYANLGHGPSPPSYSSLAGATTYSRNTYERCCVSAYTSPAMDMRGYSPQNHYNDQGVPLMNGSSGHRYGGVAADSASAREELAYAQAQAQHQKYLSQQQQQQQRGTYDNSPGVPTAPFANAGPPGVHHMQYYSEPQSHSAGSTNGVGGRGYGYSGYGASNMNAYGR